MVTRSLFALILVSVAGCSQSQPSAADPERARSALRTALDAWKNGETAESLKARSPAIYFNDIQWRDDNRLVNYEIESEQRNGFNWRCVVKLTVQSGKDKPRQRTIGYLIDTDPAIVIAPEH